MEVLKNQHENISYTIEKSKKALQFLDVAVQIHDKGVDTWVWQKSTNTGLFLNFKAVYQLNWKSGLNFMHASSCKNDLFKYDILFLKEVNQLRSLFLIDNYTSRFFGKIFKTLWPKIILYQIIFQL